MWRLIEDLSLHGIAGEILNHEQYKAIPHYNKPLAEPVIKNEYPYAYMITQSINMKQKIFGYDNIADLTTFFDRLKGIEQWVKMGFITAAGEHRSYKYHGKNNAIKLEINTDQLG